MNKLITILKNFLIAEVVTFLYILASFPLVETLPWTGHGVTLIHYLLHPQRLYAFQWDFLWSSFAELIIPIFIDVYLFYYVIKRPKQGMRLMVVIKKVVALVAIFAIPYFTMLVVGMIEVFTLI